MIRVLLIKPPIQGFYALAAGARHAPTGLMYLAHALRQTGATVRIFDSMVWQTDTHFVPPSEYNALMQKKVNCNPIFNHILHFGANWSRIRDILRAYQPDIVGITCLFTPYYRPAYRTATIVRETCPRAKIVFGGPHATVAWKHVFDHAPVDAVILGEGERTFARLLKDMGKLDVHGMQSVDVSAYPGLVVRRPEGEVIGNYDRDFIDDLDELGFPALEEMDYSAYNGSTSLITSRGCPFSCTFCSVHAIVGKMFRKRSVESVLDEMGFYAARGVKRFNIEDDNFTFDIDRVDRIMEAICRSNLEVEIRLPNGITALNMTHERLQLFAKAGVRQLFFGLESTNLATRRQMKKTFAKTEKIEDLVHAARGEGIYAFASLIIALPRQTIEDVVEDFVEMVCRGIGASANPYYPVMGTQLFREAEERKLLLEPDPEWYEAMNFPIEDGLSRGDVATAFVLGLTLAHSSFRPYHRRFLLSRHQPPAAEILSVLAKTDILVSAFGLNEVHLKLPHCFCREQKLGQITAEESVTLGLKEPCALSGKIMQMLMQLWTGQAYSVRQITCQLTDPVEHCTFRAEQVTGPLPEAADRFLARMRSARMDRTRRMLPQTYDQLAVCAESAYTHLGY